MTGHLHLPVPALIVAGADLPRRRAVHADPAGGDAAADRTGVVQLSLLRRGLGRCGGDGENAPDRSPTLAARSVRVGILIAVVGAAFGLRALGVSSVVAGDVGRGVRPRRRGDHGRLVAADRGDDPLRDLVSGRTDRGYRRQGLAVSRPHRRRLRPLRGRARRPAATTPSTRTTSGAGVPGLSCTLCGRLRRPLQGACDRLSLRRAVAGERAASLPSRWRSRFTRCFLGVRADLTGARRRPALDTGPVSITIAGNPHVCNRCPT